MKKIFVSALAVAILAMPGVSKAQSLEEQYRSYLIQLIAMLQAQIDKLIELQNMGQSIVVSEAPAVGATSVPSEPVVEKANVNVTVGQPNETRDSKGRVWFAFSYNTDADLTRVKLARPDGEYAIDGGFNPNQSQTYNVGPEYPGVFKWTITTKKEGIEDVKSGEFEIK